MQSDPPHHRYFRAKEGHWRGRVEFKITNPDLLGASGLSKSGIWSLRAMSSLSRVSALVLSTMVDHSSFAHNNEVFHTARLSHLGMTLLESQETIRLDDDGQSFQMAGSQSFFPRLAKKIEFVANGAVASDHDGATYNIPFFGATMEQRTRMTADGLEIIQTTPFSRATILLRWQRPLGNRQGPLQETSLKQIP